MKPTFYDTDCLSCFIVIDDTSILEEQFECIYLPYEVYEELTDHIYKNLRIEWIISLIRVLLK